MPSFTIIYFGIGLICAFGLLRYTHKKKVSSSLFEAFGAAIFFPVCFPFLLPILVPLVAAFWPIFFIDDVFRYIPKQRRERLALLKSELKEARKLRSTARKDLQEFQAIIGQTGTAVTDLRLLGEVRIDDRTWQASSESGYIPLGTSVVVSARRGQELQVRTITKEAEQAAS